MGQTIHELVTDSEHRLSVVIAKRLPGMQVPAYG